MGHSWLTKFGALCLNQLIREQRRRAKAHKINTCIGYTPILVIKTAYTSVVSCNAAHDLNSSNPLSARN